MPAQLALLLCSIFVAFLLRLDAKQSPKQPLSLWIPTIWALVAFSKPLGVWFGGSRESTTEAGSSLDRAFLITLLFIAIYVLFKRKFIWSNAIKNNFWLILLVAFMLISIFWSPIPYVSFKRWIREIVAVIMAFMILSEHNPRNALLILIRRLSYILLPFSLLLIKYYPKFGVDFGRWSGERMWMGVALHKNSLSRLCIIFAFFFIWTLIRRWHKRDIPVTKYQTYIEIFLFLLSLVLLMGPRRTLTHSATSTVAFGIALVAFFGVNLLKKRSLSIDKKYFIFLVMLIVFYGTITPFIGELSILDVSSILKRDETLTGRSDHIWEILVKISLSRPFVGHGYGGFWTTETHNLIATSAHNGYLEIIVNIGFLGLFIVSMFLLSCIKRASLVINNDFEWGTLFLCYLIMAAVHNIAESSLSTLSAPLMATIMFFSVSGEEG